MSEVVFDPNLDPDIEHAARTVLDACYELETIGLRLERTDPAELMNQPTLVTGAVMAQLASTDFASPELKAYAQRVQAGECQWCDIERLARPVPPEVAYLKTSGAFTWTWEPTSPPSTWPAEPQGLMPDLPQKSKGENVVGPSDWPDDFEDYPEGNTWWTH